MRLHAQTAILESGFVRIPETAPWLAEYLHELTVFPNGKHDDQADSTAQFLDWCKKPFPGQGIYEYYRQCAQEVEKQRKPQPVKTVWAIGFLHRLRRELPRNAAVRRHARSVRRYIAARSVGAKLRRLRTGLPGRRRRDHFPAPEYLAAMTSPC
jgi:hypothetical protein